MIRDCCIIFSYLDWTSDRKYLSTVHESLFLEKYWKRFTEFSVDVIEGKTYFKVNGKLHRDVDLPAVIDREGRLEWFRNNMRDRRNGLPAVVGKNNGYKEWWINGNLSRENNLHTIENELGMCFWHKNNRKHRSDGPAIIHTINAIGFSWKTWCLDGDELSSKISRKLTALSKSPESMKIIYNFFELVGNADDP